jgi:uncharacterized membrane protein YhaH (DUF805 family)
MHWLLDPITKHYFDFSGRASRQEYWMFVLFYIIVSIVVSMIATATEIYFLETIFALALLLPALGISVRRLHDVNKSGWWVLLGLIPILGFIILLTFYIQKGDPGPNQYGDNPEGNSSVVGTDTSDVPRPPSSNMTDVPKPPTDD